MTIPDDREKSVKAVEAVLGNPILDELPEYASKIRRNLMLAASVTLAYKLNGLTVAADLSALGFRLEGLDSSALNRTLFVFVAYHLIHFSWSSLNFFQVWRVRVTGTKLAHRTAGVFGSSDGDYPDDPRQSTLYTWWSQQSKKIAKIGSDASDLKDKIDAWDMTIKSSKDGHIQANLSSIVTTLAELRNDAAKLERSVTEVGSIVASNRIPVSLMRFDRWFLSLQNAQHLRWITMEWLIPIVIGALALYLVLPTSDFRSALTSIGLL